jgi:hypothetical protein
MQRLRAMPPCAVAYQQGVGAKRDGPTDAKTIYGRINCAPMLFWLCEAAGIDPALLNDAFEAVVARKSERVATQCGALWRIICMSSDEI